jgi:hypothetical protein
VDQQQRAGVGPPVGHLDLAGEVDVQVDALAATGVPDGGPQAPGPLVQQRQPPVARHRREAGGEQAVALAVPQVGDRRHRLGVEGAQRRVQVVAVLGVVDHQQAAVAGHVGQLHHLAVAVQLGGAAAELADAHREAVPARQPDRHPALGAEREPGAPGRLHVGQQRRDLAAVERLLQPAADLVALGVLEPDDLRAVGGHRARHHAGGVLGDLAVPAAGAVPGVDLPGARQVRGVDEVLGSVERPPRQGERGGAVALLPAWL